MARGIDGVPVGRDVLVRSTWRGRNELRGEPRVPWWGRVGRNRMDSLAPSTRETEEVKEGNQARRRREGHAP